MRQDTVGDYAGRTIAVIGLATPNFWLGVMVMLYPVIWWGWSPSVELIRFTDDPLGNLGMFLVPGLILGTALAASTMRMTRTMMLEVLRQDYIRTAWAKGLSERLVVVRHAMKNALIPVVTLIGLQLPILVGGSVIMENIFVLPGLGQVLLKALQDRDYPVVMGREPVLWDSGDRGESADRPALSLLGPADPLPIGTEGKNRVEVVEVCRKASKRDVTGWSIFRSDSSRPSRSEPDAGSSCWH